MKEFNLEKTVTVKLMVFNGPNARIELKNFKISFSMITMVDSDKNDNLIAQLHQNISFSKVFYFLKEIVNESILFEKEYIKDISNYLKTCNNNLIVLPDIREGTFIAALHRKLNSISHETTYVPRIKFHDVDQDLTYVYTCISDEDDYEELPSIKDWMGEFSYWKNPWWDRSDQSTWDQAAESKEELELYLSDPAGLDQQDNELFEEIESQLTDIFHNELVEAGLAEQKTGQLIEFDFKKKEDKPSKKWTPVVV
jgi:hypothetical protein